MFALFSACVKPLASTMIPRACILLHCVLLAAWGTQAPAATSPIGEAKKIVPAVTSAGENGNVTLAVGSNLFQDDLVKTGALGRAGLQFLDATQLEVGPNSSAKLDRFVFNPDKTASEVSLNLAKGVFRFVSGGRSRPETYTINTPHATLGIRGTVIQFRITEFQTDIIVEEGMVNACSKQNGGCQQLSPSLVNNAGIFTVTGFVRAFAFRNANDLGGDRTGALGGVPPSLGSSTNPAALGSRENGTSVDGGTGAPIVVPGGQQNGVLPSNSAGGGSRPAQADSFFPQDISPVPRISTSP